MVVRYHSCLGWLGFQFLGIPPKGEPRYEKARVEWENLLKFPISRDPPEGGTTFRYVRRGSYCLVTEVSNF